MFLGKAFELLREGCAVGKDEGAGAAFDAGADDFGAVANEDEGVGGDFSLEMFLEGGTGGACDKDAGLDDFVLVEGDDGLCAEGFYEQADAGGDDGLALRIDVPRHVAGEGEVVEHGDVAAVGIGDGEGDEALLVHLFESLPEGDVFLYGLDGTVDEVEDFGLEVGKELRRRDAELVQDVFCLRSELACARSDGVEALAAFEGRIGDGRDDGVGVRVTVSNDVGLAVVHLAALLQTKGANGSITCFACPLGYLLREIISSAR